MTAFASVVAASFAEIGSTPASLAELRQALEEALARAGVSAGISAPALSALALGMQDPSFERAELGVAWGSPPEAGAAASIELLFEQGLAAGKLDASGHMDFFDRGLLQAAATEQVIARLRAAEPGRAGFKVDGAVLPALPGASSKLELGPGVALEAGGAVKAKRGGVVLYRPGQLLDVVSQHVHRGAVDLHSGHLETEGSLLVKGDVELLGAVSGGSVRAGGCVRVSGSVRGGDDGQIYADGDVTARSCESAVVTARGVLRLQEAVNSQLRARQIAVAGRLRGGSAIAETCVSVKEAGSSSGALTLLQAGEPLAEPELEQVQRAVVMQKLRRMAERGGVRDAFGTRGDARGKGGKPGRLNAALSAEELTRLGALAEQRQALQREAFLEVGLAHAGVELRIGPACVTLEQSVRAARYTWDPESGQLSVERTIG